MTTESPIRDRLTRDEARERASRVSHCDYRLHIDLQEKAPTYRGEAELTFAVDGEGPLFLDFRHKRIDRLELNGEPIDPPREAYRIALPETQIRAENALFVVYENEFDHAGDGFHQFIDPEDGEEYLYSNFEPYEAHRLFPCFDQPDIKGSYDLAVTAPAAYSVISNAATESTRNLGDGRIEHTFGHIGPFSTYLFALMVGRYHSVTRDHGGIEMGLHCRTSLAKHLDADEIFEITGQGLDFYGDFFGVRYPWGKYDQLFVPEFNAGAMENVGAVAHNEYMVFRDPPTDAQRRERAEVILHEMAHMWFGDLVTMRWWDDLWLNESFATYMAYLCVDRATRFRTAWLDFNAAMKNWAYRQDQLVTTHPIAADVSDTDQTFLNFDGITYAKGASVLRQLAASIGDEGFREGMRHYFREYAYGNTDLRQFLGALEQGSGRDLGEWARLWLETASLNTISAAWQADGDRLTSLELRQTAPDEYPTIRPHRLDIGLFRGAPGGIAVDVLKADLSGARAEVPVDRAMARPDLVLPNYNDLAYAKVSLDADSVEFAMRNLEQIDDDLSRQLLWSAFWNMVRDQQLSSLRYLAVAREKLPLEQNMEMTAAVSGQALAALDRYVPDSLRIDEAHRLFEAAAKALQTAKPGDATITWARTLIGSAISPADVRFLGRLADGEESFANLTLDQDMRWSIAIRHVGLGLEGAQQRIAAEAERDPSDRGQRALIQAETSVPDAAVKAAAWEKFQGEGYGSLYLTRAAMGGFNWWSQREILEPYVTRFFASVRGIYESRDNEFSTTYFRQLFPSYRPEPAVLEMSSALLAEVEGKLPVLERSLKEANDDMARAIACRQYAAEEAGQ